MANNSLNAEHKIKVSDETRNEIFKQVEQNYKDDVNEMIYGKKCWRQTGITFETISKITVAIGGVLSFSSGYFNSNVLSFISGSISVVSLALLQFGSFGFKQSKKRANDLNILLKKLDLDTVPVIDDDPEALTSGNNKTVADKGILNNNSDEDASNSLPDTLQEEKTHNYTIKNIELDLSADIYSKNTAENITIIKNTKLENTLIP
jgi:hypothetical protein